MMLNHLQINSGLCGQLRSMYTMVMFFTLSIFCISSILLSNSDSCHLAETSTAFVPLGCVRLIIPPSIFFDGLPYFYYFCLIGFLCVFDISFNCIVYKVRILA